MKNKNLLKHPIEYVKGVGPKKAEALQKELQIFNVGDILMDFPFRYVDKSEFYTISQAKNVGENESVQLVGILQNLQIMGEGRRKRLSATLRDDTGRLQLVWFKGVTWLYDKLQEGARYVAYGKLNDFNGNKNMPHPELEIYKPTNRPTLDAVYHSTDGLTKKGLDSKGRRNIIRNILPHIQATDIPENIPQHLLTQYKLPSRYDAIVQIHQPNDKNSLKSAINRLKYEELFMIQMKLILSKINRKNQLKGYCFEKVGEKFLQFFNHELGFELTGAQKRVIKEIRQEVNAGSHMNRLVQGDVGSGKTIVAFMVMLLAIDNGFQAALMAPTEVLAYQHYKSLSETGKNLDISIEFLSGSVKGKKRAAILERLAAGEIDILIGTHALVEPPVIFKNLGLGIIDEQHRFGVKQRAALWKKNKPLPPHILVMTATPIPRTLAMTVYGDLDISLIDELPPGRREIQTLHKYESHRLTVFKMIADEIAKGRQAYIVYPLIEENEELELTSLYEGMIAIERSFPKPKFQISMVHGRMKPDDKEYEMQRFKNGETQIMVATTVIEVGVNVPNATLMVIEHTERFGLSQLHQLRGRVGRGGEQSYCVLMSGHKLTKEGRKRIETMVRTTNGFEIADVDLQLRGPGNIEGTQQSGVLKFNIANLKEDSRILAVARRDADDILKNDPALNDSKFQALKEFLSTDAASRNWWSRVS